MNGNADMKNVELLAPAGTYEAFRAAINAGADAVYLGGSAFGARAYAGNFDKEQLLEALDFAHIRDRKVYLTVNTLLKENEMGEPLYDYLLPFYEAGLDAVIVQDWGVFDLIQKAFPGLDIHASTQMAVTGCESAGLLKRMGATRVVPARELTLDDIKKIDQNFDIEIESFVHGALCYSYSGQCLMSSMLGDRSGNRGRCAQPCRMKYDNEYVLSLKDMCTLELIPQLVQAGVDSFKIEGRMKSSEYVAGVVSVYRRYLDKYLEYGKNAVKPHERDLISLSDLYNRGGFSKGYYPGKKDRDMVSLTKPNHQGTCAMEVISSKPGSAVCKALVPLNKGDVFDLEKEFDYTLAGAVKPGGMVTLSLPKKYVMQKGRKLYRVRNNSLINDILDRYTKADCKTAIQGAVTLQPDKEASLVLWKDDTCIAVQGETVMRAMNRPLTAEGVQMQISRMNDTPYILENLEINMDNDVFLPNGKLNELRRKAVTELTNALTARYKRSTDNCSAQAAFEWQHQSEHKGFTGNKVNVMIDSVSSDCMDMIRFVSSMDGIDGIYIEAEAFEDSKELAAMVDIIHKDGHNAYISLPYVVRGRTSEYIEKLAEDADMINADAWLVRNLESAAIITRLRPDDRIITDAGLYTMNSRARMRFDIEFPQIITDTAPYELTVNELLQLGIGNSELMVYGRVPVMISENCVRKTRNMCDGMCGVTKITDDRKRCFDVASRCRNCYAVTYMSDAVSVLDMPEQIRRMAPGSWRLTFTSEDKGCISHIIRDAILISEGKNMSGECYTHTTHGHFDRQIL